MFLLTKVRRIATTRNEPYLKPHILIYDDVLLGTPIPQEATEWKIDHHHITQRPVRCQIRLIIPPHLIQNVTIGNPRSKLTLRKLLIVAELFIVPSTRCVASQIKNTLTELKVEVLGNDEVAPLLFYGHRLVHKPKLSRSQPQIQLAHLLVQRPLARATTSIDHTPAWLLGNSHSYPPALMIVGWQNDQWCNSLNLALAPLFKEESQSENKASPWNYWWNPPDYQFRVNTPRDGNKEATRISIHNPALTSSSSLERLLEK